MRIVQFKIENFKSFRETNSIQLTPGFNVIVGQNNAGKTALVTALTVKRLVSSPHRSLETIPTRDFQYPAAPRLTLTFELSGKELDDMFPNKSIEPYLEVASQDFIHNTLAKFHSKISHGQFHFTYKFATGGALSDAIIEGFSSSDRVANRLQGVPVKWGLESDNLRQYSSTQRVGVANLESFIQHQIATRLVNSLYMFNAERLRIGVAPMRVGFDLESDASNLPSALHFLRNQNPALFDYYMSYVKRVFPEITEIITPPLSDQNVEIRLWTIPPETYRDDLAIPLMESGTGISQVLAILYIVVTSFAPKVIIIDEPQSFLHPGAIRKLFEILKEYPQHQYILTTHSPTVITASDPQAILLVRKNGAESTITSLDVAKTDEANIVLREIGARLADVFGAENILWVEGPTEETSFPKILATLAQKPWLGTVVRGVLNTGDFDKRSRERTLDIYRHLITGVGILPPAIGFIFDREMQNEQYVSDLNAQHADRVYFTQRRMYESYLLDPDAIAAIMSTLADLPEPSPTASDIAAWIENERWNVKFFPSNLERTPEIWITNVDAAKLLDVMFQHFLGELHRFHKTTHSVALTEWLLEHKPEALREVADLISKVLDTGRAQLNQ